MRLPQPREPQPPRRLQLVRALVPIRVSGYYLVIIMPYNGRFRLIIVRVTAVVQTKGMMVRAISVILEVLKL